MPVIPEIPGIADWLKAQKAGNDRRPGSHLCRLHLRPRPLPGRIAARLPVLQYARHLRTVLADAVDVVHKFPGNSCCPSDSGRGPGFFRGSHGARGMEGLFTNPGEGSRRTACRDDIGRASIGWTSKQPTVLVSTASFSITESALKGPNNKARGSAPGIGTRTVQAL